MEQEVINGAITEKSERSAPKRFRDYLFYKDHDDDNDYSSIVFA